MTKTHRKSKFIGVQICLQKAYLYIDINFRKEWIVIKCIKCNKIWEEKSFITSNTYICPFCGADLQGSTNENKELNIRMALKEVIDQYDIEVINDVKRVNAILMDYVPKLQRERKLIISALKEGVASELLKSVALSDDEKKQSATRCIKQLVSDIWVTESAAYYAVSSIAFAIGLNVDIEFEQFNETPSNSPGEIISLDNKEITKGNYDGSEDINRILNKYGIIGYKAFAMNKNIESIELSDRIKRIKSKAFINCLNLHTIKISSNIETIAEQVFNGCFKLENIIVENNSHYCVTNNILIDKSKRKVLRASNKDAAEVSIPDGITKICNRAFDRNMTAKVIIPKSVTDISPHSFYECYKLKEYFIDSKNQVYCSIDGIIHSRDRSKLYLYPIGKEDTNYFIEDDVVEIKERAFSKAVRLISITFNSLIKVIGNGAFEYCQSIESIMLPGSIEKIGERAFQYCKKLRSVMLSRNINEIGDFAFCECESLENISIPKNVERIGNSAFLNCKKLEKVIIQDNVRHIGEAAFNGCQSSLHISIKNNQYVENYCRSHNISYEIM